MKNWFKKQRLFVQIRFGIFAFIIGAGIYFGNIKFSFGTPLSTTVSPEKILQQLSHIQNITGKLWSAPGAFDTRSQIVASTHKNLKIQTYEFTEKRIRSLLKTLLDAGVDVQILMEDKKFQQYQNTFKKVQNYFSGYSNFALKSDRHMGTEYLHSKINILDSGFIIQTANLTHSSFFTNREHFFWSQDLGVLQSLKTLFDKDRKGEKIQLKDIHPNLVVCNINCRIIIEKLLSDAKTSLIIQTQYITDKNIIHILNTQFVPEKRILLADTEDNLELIKELKNADVKRLKKYYNHTKMILIDKKILLLGSMNLSSTSLDKNREIGIIIIDPTIINEFLLQFEKDWQMAD